MLAAMGAMRSSEASAGLEMGLEISAFTKLRPFLHHLAIEDAGKVGG